MDCDRGDSIVDEGKENLSCFVREISSDYESRAEGGFFKPVRMVQLSVSTSLKDL